MSVAAIVPAAGRGERLGPGVPKALRPLGGVPMLVHAVRALSRARSVDLVVVAAPPEEVAGVQALLATSQLGADVEVVAGGATRQESVRRALDALPDAVDLVLVHDAARPLAPSELADAVVTALRTPADGTGEPVVAVVPALPVVDTVRVVHVSRAGARLEVAVATPDRGSLRAVQTPQGFRRTVLTDAHAAASERADAAATDDAGLVELLGQRVHVVPGSPEAFKVTRPLDLVLAEALVAQRSAERVVR